MTDFCQKNGGKKLQSSDFYKNMVSGSFYLSRRVQKGTAWHPTNDALRGTKAYGTVPTDPTSGATGSIKWDYNKVQYFMFSTGDFSEWYGDALACLLLPVLLFCLFVKRIWLRRY